MKVYIPNNSRQSVGGGWTFIRNLKEALKGEAFFVDQMEAADIVLIVGVTITDKNELHQAKKLGKKIILRVDNVPRKSRNNRQTPHERLKEFAEIADVVIYQSEWAKNYCLPLCGDGAIIHNGVDQSIFYPPKEKPEKDISLFAYHGKSELKCFWQAHYFFQMHFRNNTDAEFWFIYDFGKELETLKFANFDFWQGEKYKYLEKITNPDKMADLMRQCKRLIFPSFADAAPNTVLEARACGLKVNCSALPDDSGTRELLNPELDISLERMGIEYLSLFKLVLDPSV